MGSDSPREPEPESLIFKNIDGHAAMAKLNVGCQEIFTYVKKSLQAFCEGATTQAAAS